MPHENAFEGNLADPVARKKLKPRYPPYWQVTEYGRAIGFHKYEHAGEFWVARARLRDGYYKQRRLAVVQVCEEGPGVEFDDALRLAEEWYNTISHRTSDAIPIGNREHLIICPVGNVFTIGHALTDFLEWKRMAAARSHFVTLISVMNYHIVPRLASVPAADFNGEVVRNFVKDILETPAKRGNMHGLFVPAKRPISQMSVDELRRRKVTINVLLSVLRVALQMAWENGKIDSERAWRCIRRLPVVHRPRILHLSRQECRRLLEQCTPDLARFVLGALYTGCRATELLRMTVAHVECDGPGVYVTPVKSYTPRFVFLPEEGLQFFRRLAAGRDPDAPLFLRENGRQWFDNYKHPFKRAVIAAGLPKAFCFHGLRHTYASQLSQAGTPLLVIAEQLGHRNIETVSRTYGHMQPQIRSSEVRARFEGIQADE